jgi:hypothetical protein
MVAVGAQAMSNNVVNNDYDVAVGYAALKGAAGSTAYNDTALGANAGLAVTSASADVFVGFQTGKAVTTAASNTFLGFEAGLAVTTGGTNTIIGAVVSGTTLTTGTGNIIIGSGNATSTCDTAASNTSNTFALCGPTASPFLSATATSTPSSSILTIAGTTVFGGQITLASSTTGATTQTYTNGPCTTSATTAQWIPVSITGQSGTFYIAACH